MTYKNLSAFLEYLESRGHLHRITHPISTKLEITEISRRALENRGPALLFENVIKDDGTKSAHPVLTNLYSHADRISWGLGLKDSTELRDFGKLLATLRQPEAPSSWRQIPQMLPLAKRILSMSPKNVKQAECQQIIIENPDLTILPIQTCWPKDIAPLITWPIVVTKGPSNSKVDNYNLGIYRMQVVSHNKLIMRWLALRGGAQQYQRAQLAKRDKFEAAIVIGVSPSVTLAAVMPLPENVSEYNFAGLLANKNLELVNCHTLNLKVPASAEIVLEGEVSFDEYLPEGPFGDHTGYYNEVESFPVFTVKAITMRKNATYLSTYTGKPPDEPSILGEALNELVIPLLQQQFPEIEDFYLPPEGCSYRIALVSIKKSYPGQAKRIMMGLWSFLKQFMYTKFVIVVDDDINIRNWQEVIWAISTRVDPKRDTVMIENTPIDYLDFASIKPGLGSKMGVDATNKIPPETDRNWGEEIIMSSKIIEKINNIWDELGIPKI